MVKMQMDILNQSGTDEQAVDAVRGGDVDRYRELVERHERLVYAVAWSRLGDAALAEEVTQETFIRAYQRLSLLHEGAKFSQWIASMARNLAINFGLRHRRELNKRERWALEVEQGTTVSQSEPREELCTPEMLRETMASLPSGHRECLILFYLENKSNAESAEVLGISEATFRVRLHRARVALREQLEGRLSQSLEQLRPRNPVAPAVMGAVLASPSLKAGGSVAFMKLIPAWLVKAWPVKTVAWLPFAFTFIPGILMQWWVGKAEAKNFRDQKGFRARLHRENARKRMWIGSLIPALMLLLMMRAMRWFGDQTLYLVIGAFASYTGFFALRNLELLRNKHGIWLATNSVLMAVTTLAIGFGLLSHGSLQIVIVVSLIGTAFTMSRPTRMDYNLFLRANQRLLADEQPVAASPTQSRHDLMSFARFLAERWLVVSFRWEQNSLVLELPPVRPSLRWNYVGKLPPFSRNSSSVSLNPDGSIAASLSVKDEEALVRFSDDVGSVESLETIVTESLLRARAAFVNREVAKAEKILGQLPEQEVFVVPGKDAPGMSRYRRLTFTLLVVTLVIVFAKHYGKTHRFKPVNVTEGQPGRP